MQNHFLHCVIFFALRTPFGDGSRRNQYTARIRVARDWLKDFCEFPNVIGAGEFSAEMITMPAQASFGVLLHRHCPSKSQPAFKNHQTTSCPNITTYVILWTTNSYRKMAMILTPRAPASFISAAGGARHPWLADNRLHGTSDVKSFILPNYDEEQHRLDNIQVMFKAYFGDTVIAPVPHDVHKILDCGTGSGIVPGAERYNK